VAKDTLKNATDAVRGGEDQMRDGTVTGASAKGYAEHYCDGSEYNKFGNRIDLNKLAAHSFH
jgi:hypothetical protein